MKPTKMIVAIVMILLTQNLYAQTACDTALVGVNVNLSIGANCRLDIDSNSVQHLIANYSGSLTYQVTVFDSTRTDTIRMPVQGEAIGQTYMVRIVPTNCPDSLTSEAWSIVYIEDYIPPRLTCVVDTASCQDFTHSEPTGIEECDEYRVDILSLQYTPACSPPIPGISTIAIRSYRVTDGSGNSSECTDTTYIRRVDPDSILFPMDTVFSCEELDSLLDADRNLIAPSLLLADGTGTLTDQYPLGVPTIGGSSLYSGRFRGCRTRAYYEDLLLDSVQYCRYRYLRRWTAYEWYCDQELEYPHMQFITFKDTIEPTISVNTDTLYYDITNDACEVRIPTDSLRRYIDATDNCTPAEELTVRYSYPYQIGSRIDSIIVIEGADTVIVDITVSDRCGGHVHDSLVIITRDRQDPVALCEGIVGITITNATNNPLPITHLNRGSYDGCRGDVTLSARKMHDTTYYNDQLIFGCADANITELAAILRVTDDSGNFDECMTMIDLTVDTSVINCDTVSPSFSQGGIYGTVRYTNESPVTGTSVHVISDQEAKATNTDANGYYSIRNIAYSHTLEITPQKEAPANNSISTMDLLMVQRHMLGIEELPSAYQVIAGDINVDGRISIKDVVELRKLLLGHTDRFSKTDSYRFVPSDMTFVEPMDPWADGEVFGKVLHSMSSANTVQDFVAIKIGDVDQSALRSDPRHTSNIKLKYEILPMGRFFELNVYPSELLSIEGFQGVLSFDPQLMRLMKVGSADIALKKDNYSLSNVSEGKIALSWSDIRPTSLSTEEPLLRFTFEKFADIEPIFSFDNERLRAEAYLKDRSYTLTLYKEENTPSEFTISHNVPNPWNDKTRIEYNVPKAAHVKLNVYDAAMNKIYSDAQDATSGRNSFVVSNGDLPHQGLYFYEIIYAGQIRVSKMTRL